MSLFSWGERFWLIGLSLILGITVLIRMTSIHSQRPLLHHPSVRAAELTGDPSQSQAGSGSHYEALTDSQPKHALEMTDETDDFPIDINTAPVDLLVQLPGIGPVIAGRIVAYREEHGPFQHVDELKQVAGIGDARMEQIRSYVIVRIEEAHPPSLATDDNGNNDEKSQPRQASE